MCDQQMILRRNEQVRTDPSARIDDRTRKMQDFIRSVGFRIVREDPYRNNGDETGRQHATCFFDVGSVLEDQFRDPVTIDVPQGTGRRLQRRLFFNILDLGLVLAQDLEVGVAYLCHIHGFRRCLGRSFRRCLRRRGLRCRLFRSRGCCSCLRLGRLRRGRGLCIGALHLCGGRTRRILCFRLRTVIASGPCKKHARSQNQRGHSSFHLLSSPVCQSSSERPEAPATTSRMLSMTG